MAAKALETRFGNFTFTAADMVTGGPTNDEPPTTLLTVATAISLTSADLTTLVPSGWESGGMYYWDHHINFVVEYIASWMAFIFLLFCCIVLIALVLGACGMLVFIGGALLYESAKSWNWSTWIRMPRRSQPGSSDIGHPGTEAEALVMGRTSSGMGAPLVSENDGRTATAPGGEDWGQGDIEKIRLCDISGDVDGDSDYEKFMESRCHPDGK